VCRTALRALYCGLSTPADYRWWRPVLTTAACGDKQLADLVLVCLMDVLFVQFFRRTSCHFQINTESGLTFRSVCGLFDQGSESSL